MIHDGGYFTVFLNWVVRRLCEECGLLELAFLSRRRRRQWSEFWMLLGRTLTSRLPLSHRRRGFPCSGVLCDRCVGERKVRPMYFPRPAYFLSPEVPLILYFVFCILCFVFCIFVFYLQFSVCKTDANKGLAILPETSEPGIGSGAVRTFQTNKLSNKGLL